jgi:hypothetical protein
MKFSMATTAIIFGFNDWFRVFTGTLDATSTGTSRPCFAEPVKPAPICTMASWA